MSQPEVLSETILPNWVDSTIFKGMLRGIERETLRMQSNGFISKNDHPKGLGSALTHPHITTDYSEALLEFITPPQSSIPEALSYLEDIHAYTNQHLAEGEKLWPMSMPCMLDDDEESIRLAQYGSSNIGKFKTLYRRGLGVRYGRRMQTISGVHYNVSFPDELFQQLQQNETDERLKQLNLQDYRSHRYFGLIRNFIRLTPLVTFLIGASPSVCRCFMTGRDHQLLPLISGTLYLPYATALRMGRFGYQNSAQKELGIHYNDLNGYLDGIQKAVRTSYAAFSRLGLDDDAGEPIQINDHVLQIENEYYSLVRPKQVPESGETPSEALANRGVGYVELRAVDVNPYSPIGINEDTAGFLEVLALYCLLKDSPSLFDDELEVVEQNQNEVVNRGRAPNATIIENGQAIEIETWVNSYLIQMKPLAVSLDQAHNSTLYSSALNVMQSRVDEVDETYSAQIVKDTIAHNGTWSLGSVLAQQHTEHYQNYPLSDERVKYFDDLTVQSIEQQQKLELECNLNFKEYLKAYR
jgi:glutamate--cysteine ligase